MDTDDRFIAGMRDAARKMAAHEHGTRPSVGAPDLYCLNLSSWAGERTGTLLDRYDAAVLRAIDAEQAHARDREEWEHTKRALAANASALVRAENLIVRLGLWVEGCDAHKANHDELIAAYHDYEEGN